MVPFYSLRIVNRNIIIGSPDDDALALQSCNLVNRFTDAVQTYNVHTRDSIKNDSERLVF